MSDESRSFWNLVGNGQQPDSNGFIKIDTTKLTSSSSLFNENLHPNSSSYHASPFSQYLHQDSTDFGSIGGLVQNLQGRLNTWVQTSPTVLGFSQELVRSGNIADEYRLQALEAGEYILEEVQKDAGQIFEKTNAVLSKKAQEFVIAHPELAGQVDELKHQVTEAADQVTEEVSKTLKSVGLKALSMVYDGLKIAYDRSDQMTTEFPGRWKLFAGEMAERTLQVREAVKDVVDKTAVSLRDQSTSTQVSPGDGIIAPTAYSATTSTLPIGSNSSEPHTGAFEGTVIAEAGAIVRSGAGRSFQAVAERYGFRSKVQFDAWKTGEMVDYSQELGTKSDRWYRIVGTDSWVSGAIVTTNMNLDNPGQVSKNSAPQVTAETPFKGRIIATQANVRSGAGSQFEDVGDRFRGDVVEFDGRVKGQFVDYRSTLGKASDEWFRIKGTNQLISAALISMDMGEPDGVPNSSTSGAGNTIKANLDLPVYKEDNPFIKAGYGAPNCTWYANGRLKELGYDAKLVDKMMGNAHQWDDQARSAGLTISKEPKVGMIAVWEPGHGGSTVFGHVAIVEQVNADGSIVISESNWNGKVHNVRTIHPHASAWADHFILASINNSNTSKIDDVNKVSDSKNTDSEKNKDNLTSSNDSAQNIQKNNIKGNAIGNTAVNTALNTLTRTGAPSENKYTFDEILDRLKKVEETVPKRQVWWWDEYDPYAVANTLRRKGRSKYWGNEDGSNAFDNTTGWKKTDGYATGESLNEFISGGNDTDRVVRLANDMEIPISHFFAALSAQFGNLTSYIIATAQPDYFSYIGDLGSVVGALNEPKFWLQDKNYLGKPTLDQAFKLKSSPDQLDADILAHVVAYAVEHDNKTISQALADVNNISKQEIYNKFSEIEFDIDISKNINTDPQQNEDIKKKIENKIVDKIHSFLRDHSGMNAKSKLLGERDELKVYGYFWAQDSEIKKVAGRFLNHLGVKTVV